jgi:hypothetical protein
MNTLKQTLAYIVVLLIAAISTKYEFDAYKHLLAQMSAPIENLWPLLVAVAFNLGKILLFQSIIEAKSKSLFKLWKSYLALTLLMVNSFVCAFCVMSYSLESPQLERVVQEQKQHVNEGQNRKEQAVNGKFDNLRESLESQFTKESQRNIELYQPQIDKYDVDLTAERENKNQFTGVFNGIRYKEILRLLNEAKADLKAVNTKSRNAFNNKMAVLNNKMEGELQALSDEYTHLHNNLSIDAIKASGNERIHDDMLVSSLKVFNGITISSAIYLHLIGFFAFLMALIVESLAFAILQYIHRLQQELDDDDTPPTLQEVITSIPYLSTAA